MSAKHSLSLVVPCFNEEESILDTVKEIDQALAGLIDDYEFLIFNDCSSDRTKEIVDSLAAVHPKVRPIHNPVNKGLGYNFKTGVQIASKEYIVMFPGDNELTLQSIREICQHIGTVDMVISYIQNYKVRPLHRQFLSKCFTLFANFIMGQSIQYYNGPVLHKVSNLRSINLVTNGFAYQFEIISQLLWRKSSYIEVPMVLRPRYYGNSRALRIKNIITVIRTLIRCYRKEGWTR